MDDTSLTLEKPLISYELSVGRLRRSLPNWGFLRACMKAWWRGGATVNIQAMGRLSGSGVTVNGERMAMTVTHLIVTVTPK